MHNSNGLPDMPADAGINMAMIMKGIHNRRNVAIADFAVLYWHAAAALKFELNSLAWTAYHAV